MINMNSVQTETFSLIPSLQQVIHFPKGLVGFHDYHDFFWHTYDHDSFSLLESCDDASVRFLLSHLSWDFYDPIDLAYSMKGEEIEEIDDQIYVIACCNSERPTLNLRAPLVKSNTTMWQIILSQKYPLDFPLDS
jgi:flagellar assembly factor FliW